MKKRNQYREEKQRDMAAAASLLDLSTALGFPDVVPLDESVTEADMEDFCHGTSVQTDMTAANIAHLQDEVNHLTAEKVQLNQDMSRMRISEESFWDDDGKTKFYTGLNTFAILMKLFRMVKDHISHTSVSSLTIFQKVVMTLMKLRLNLSYQDLGYRFGVSQSTVSRIFISTLDIMYDRTHFMIRWHSREELRQTMPMEFRRTFGNKVAAIIDCFEVFVDRPSNLGARSQTWSSYKHHNTLKFFICISP